MSGTRWSRDELIVVLDLYLNHPEVGTQITDEAVKKWADRIGRSAGAVSSRLGNYQSLDPDSSVGMERASSDCEEIWREYHQNQIELAYEADRALERLQSETTENEGGDRRDGEIETGETEITGTSRQGQYDFRAAVRDRYDDSCLVCHISNPDLLQAAHILSWSDEPRARGDPANGVLLCYNHHQAFDLEMFTITEDYSLAVRDDIKETEFGENLSNSQPLTLEGKGPSPEYLRRRNEGLRWFQRNR